MKKFYGIYPGIVIQNNDPERSGKCKIFIPYVSPQIYENWINIPKDRHYKFIGLNINSDLTEIIEDLKAILPWSIPASPLINENATGRFHAKTQNASISDSSYLASFVPKTDVAEGDLNKDDIGEKPGYVYELEKWALSDEFKGLETHTNVANFLSHYYRPKTYSNLPKGLFGIPNVGAHVWCFFYEGNPLAPVYFAVSYSAEDWQRIYSEIDYPGAFESKGPPSESNTYHVNKYRSKFVLNQRGGSMEINNTSHKESVNITHASGSFIEMNNQANIELATQNSQKLILGDSFITIRGKDNNYICQDQDWIIRGDRYKKIGSLNFEAMEKWKEIVGVIADIKQRFDIRRAEAIPAPDSGIPLTSTTQIREGSFGPPPTTEYIVLNNEHKFVTTGTRKFGIKNDQVRQYASSIVQPIGQQSEPSKDTFTMPANRSSMGGNWVVDPDKEELRNLIKSKAVELAKIEQELGMGGNEIITITKNKTETIGIGVNDFGSIRVDLIGKMLDAEVLIDEKGVYVNKSPSPLIEYVHVDDMPGGSYNLTICNKYNVQVGSGGINFQTTGNLNISGAITNIAGDQINIASNHEININSDARLCISAEILILRQKNQRHILMDGTVGVSRNLIVSGAAHIEGELHVNHITAPVEIQRTEETTVFGRAVGSSDNDNKGGNIIGYLRKSDFVALTTKTIKSKKYKWEVRAEPDGKLVRKSTGKSRGDVILTGDIPIRAIGSKGQLPHENSIKTYAHSHHFKNIPLRLMSSHTGVRREASILNQGNVIKPSHPVDHSYKTPIS